MEGDMFVILLRHRKDIGTIRHKHVTAVFIGSHILCFAFFEGVQLCSIVAFNPAGFVHLQRLPAAFSLILMLQSILNYLKLQLTNRSNNLSTIQLADKQLCYTFVHQLRHTFVQLFEGKGRRSQCI